VPTRTGGRRSGQRESGSASPASRGHRRPRASAVPVATPTPTPTAAYTITDLGSLGFGDSDATGINATGQVTGDSDLPTTIKVTCYYTGHFCLVHPTNAFLYSNGTMTGLGTLGGTDSVGNAINRAGQVVGRSNNKVGAAGGFHCRDCRACTYSHGQATRSVRARATPSADRRRLDTSGGHSSAVASGAEPKTAKIGDATVLTNARGFTLSCFASGYQCPQRGIAGEEPTSTSSSGGSRSGASENAVSRAWPSSTTRSPSGPVVIGRPPGYAVSG